MPLDVYGFVFGRLLAQREGIEDPQAQDRIAILQAFLGTSPLNLIVVDQFARNEAAAQTAVPPPAPVPSTSTPTTSSLKVQVPHVTGKAFDNARTQLQLCGLQTQRQEMTSLTDERGQVIKQDPPAGETVPIGTIVTLSVSQGVAVPNVYGMPYDQAKDSLASGNLQVVREAQTSKTVQEGYVISQNPVAGTLVSPKKSFVTLYVSLGPSKEIP
jgi:serine/threonine-protein kinase